VFFADAAALAVAFAFLAVIPQGSASSFAVAWFFCCLFAGEMSGL
jgi:hypothetical protein